MATKPGKWAGDGVGARVRRRREALKMSLETCATAIGVQRGTLSKYETGHRRLPGHALMRLADVFGCDPVELAGAPSGVPVEGDWRLRVLEKAHKLMPNATSQELAACMPEAKDWEESLAHLLVANLRAKRVTRELVRMGAVPEHGLDLSRVFGLQPTRGTGLPTTTTLPALWDGVDQQDLRLAATQANLGLVELQALLRGVVATH